MKKQITLSLLLFSLTAQSLGASDYQILSNQPNASVVNLLEYDLCRLEMEQRLIRSEYKKNDLEGFLNKSSQILVATIVVWMLVYFDLLADKPRLPVLLGVPAFVGLPFVWIVSCGLLSKAARDKRLLEKIEIAKKTIKEQLAAYGVTARDIK